jgi:hypothetical protein
VPVTQGARLLDIQKVQEQSLLPAYVMYYSRLEWHSGATRDEGITASHRFAYALLLPVRMKTVHGQTVYTYERADLKMERTVFHCLIPIDSIDRPLIVDRSEESAVTLFPFLGRGLDQAAEDDGQSEEHVDEFDSDDLDETAG